MSTLLLLTWLAVFSPSEGETLTGQKVNLPDDFHGRAVLVIAGFTKDSQKQTEQWAKRAATDFPGLQTWSIADLEDVPRLIRPIVIKAMKNSIPAARHDRFVILTKGGTQLADALGCPRTGPNKDDACVVFRASQNVVWQSHGPPTSDILAELSAALHH